MCLKHASRAVHSFWSLVHNVFMYYVYVLKSLKYISQKLYYGSTSDLKSRIQQHNNGTNKSTKYGIPWKLIYYEAFLNKQDAVNRERALKIGSSSIGFLKRRIKHSLDSD